MEAGAFGTNAGCCSDGWLWLASWSGWESWLEIGEATSLLFYRAL